MNRIITIGREFGSGGREIGILTAKLAGIPYYDGELLKKAAKDQGVPVSMLEYYDEKLPPILDQCIRNIFEVRKITSELQKNTSWEKVMVEKIVNSVNGQGKFDEFTKNDIDDVIKMFQELQTKVEG